MGTLKYMVVDHGALHGDLSQNQRDLVMKSFRIKQIKILVATC